MTKTRSALDKFKLYFEKLPSDAEADESARRYRQRQKAKQKADIRKFVEQNTLAITTAIVAKLRRVKR